MKPLVIYYSLTGNTRFIAENIALEAGADVLEIRTAKPIKMRIILWNIIGALQVITRFMPRLRFFDRNPYSYDLIIIGTPVWAGNYAPAIRTLLHKIDLSNKKVAIFCCHSGRTGRTLEDMQKALHGSDLVGRKSFYRPLSFEKARNANIAKGWIKDIIRTSYAISETKDKKERILLKAS
jgi:flavodoxin